jgi:hypothetical protein
MEALKWQFRLAQLLYPTFPGFAVVVRGRIARSGVLGGGKRAPHPQEAV